MSVDRILYSVFDKQSICPSYLWHEILFSRQETLYSYRLFHGHFYSYLGLLVDVPLRCFVFLRDPIERALSHYSHVLMDKTHYLHNRAIELGSLDAYLRDPVTRETVSNFQAKCLTTQLDPLEIAKKLSEPELNSLVLEKIIETTPSKLSNDELLLQSKEQLKNFCMVGITERFKESIWLLEKTFSWISKCHECVENSTPDRIKIDEITPEETKLLYKLNAVDFELYKYALKLFDEQLISHCTISETAIPKFISYAQNFEDVILWRALKKIKYGFYIDVGANDPSIDSVTKAFYEHGWKGINIEPLEIHYVDLLRQRQRDINLCCAAGAEKGEIELWECDVRGWASASKDVIAKHIEGGHKGTFHKVPVFPLAEICTDYVCDEIHFLKIDVEGYEEMVLQGMDFSRFRPWIVLIEATRPNSTEELYKDWEPILLKAGYQLAYEDGVNRFYLANAHTELLPAFRFPPNVFDQFVLRAQQQAEEQVNILLNSTSWRITAPLRRAAKLIEQVSNKLHLIKRPM